MANVEDALKELSGFIEKLDFNREPPADFTAEPFVMLSRDVDALVFVVGDDADTYTQIVQRLFSAVEARQTLSRDAVERFVGDAIVALASTKRTKPENFNNELQERIRALRRELAAEPAEWEFYIPVIGLAPSELPFTVGAVEFYLADKTGSLEYWKRVSEAIPEYSGKQPSVAAVADFQGQYGEKPVARVRVHAVDYRAAEDRALKAVRRTLDSLNFYANRDSGMGLYVKGDAEQGGRLHVAIKLTMNDKGVRGRMTRIAPWRTMPLQQISERGHGFRRVSELLSKQEPTKLEDRLLTALQWAGRARIDPRREESFLLFAVALETLLLGTRNTTDLGYKLKLRCAHLLSAADLDSRKLVVKQIGELYDTRSKIVHSGKFDVTDSEIYLLDQYTRIALFIVLDREPFRSMSAEEDFEAWFEARVLGIEATTRPATTEPRG